MESKGDEDGHWVGMGMRRGFLGLGLGLGWVGLVV